MAHHGDPDRHQVAHHLRDVLASFQLHSADTHLLHHPAAVPHRLVGAVLIRHEGHVDDNERVADRALHRLGMVDHIVNGHRKGGGVALHHVAQGIAHQDNVHAHLVKVPRHQEVIGREHGDLLADLLHGEHGLGRDHPGAPGAALTLGGLCLPSCH